MPHRRPRRRPDRRPLPLLRPPGHGREPVAVQPWRTFPARTQEVLQRRPRRPHPLPPRLQQQRRPQRSISTTKWTYRVAEISIDLELGGEDPQDRRPDPRQHQARKARPARQRARHPLHTLESRPRPHLRPPPTAAARPPSRSTTAGSRRLRARSRDPGPLTKTARGAARRRRPRLKDRTAQKIQTLGLEAGRRSGSRTDIRTTTFQIQAISASNNIVVDAMDVEMVFDSGLEIRARATLPDTFVLSYANELLRVPPPRRWLPRAPLAEYNKSYTVPRTSSRRRRRLPSVLHRVSSTSSR